MDKYNKQNPTTIQKMFGNIAADYDRTNAILSFQLHRLWNAALVKRTLKTDHSKTLIDLCCGTGDIGYRAFEKNRNLEHIHLIDFCPEMLACAEDKAKKARYPMDKFSFIQADVQELPLESASADNAVIAYGIRNVKEPVTCFKEVYRVLKVGGSFGILELTEPKGLLLQRGHRFYLQNILPLLGKWLTSDEDAYRYLCNSIHTFVKPEELEKSLIKTGFTSVSSYPLTAGIATIIHATK